MDDQRFRHRLIGFVLGIGLVFVAFDLLTGAEWMAAALRLLA